MLLREGISGFTTVKLIKRNGNCHILMGKDEFKKVCYSIGNVIKIHIRKFDFELLSQNYYMAEVEHDEKLIYVLLNAYYPYVAFTYSENKCNLEFIENQVLENEFSKYYRVLKPNELNLDIETEEINQLNEQEKREVSYYKPKTIGEIIFNYWD